MKKYLLLGVLPFLLFGLSGCGEEEIKIEVARYRVVDIPDALYTGCPDIRKSSIPDYKSLTDEQVGKFVVKLYRNNVKCRQTIEAIHTYLNDAHKTVDGKPVNLH